jgi:hypothetical protein
MPPHAKSNVEATIQPAASPLAYASAAIAPASKPRALWRVPLALGLLQFPWYFLSYVALEFWHSMKHVDLLPDTLFYLFCLSLTLAALGLSAWNGVRALRQRRLLIAALCVAIFAVSFIPLSHGARDWYFAIYKNPGGTWGPL